MGSLLKICWRDRTNAGLLSGTQHGKIIQAKKGEEVKGGKWDNGLTFTEFVQNYHIQLNEQQMQAVQATEGPVLLLMGFSLLSASEFLQTEKWRCAKQ